MKNMDVIFFFLVWFSSNRLWDGLRWTPDREVILFLRLHIIMMHLFIRFVPRNIINAKLSILFLFYFFLSPGGAAFIFPSTSVYPEATQRIATRPGMQETIFYVLWSSLLIFFTILLSQRILVLNICSHTGSFDCFSSTDEAGLIKYF